MYQSVVIACVLISGIFFITESHQHLQCICGPLCSF